jgi:uncharacterized protein YigE (DUF2233 family)
MKKIFWLVLLAGSIGFLLKAADSMDLFRPPGSVTSRPSPTPVAGSANRMLGLVEYEDELTEITVNGQSYRFAWVVVKPAGVRVGVNTDLETSSADIRTAGQCRVLVNGGFYNTDNKPMGLLVSEGKELSPWKENSLFNGVIGWSRHRDEMAVVLHAQQAYLELADDRRMWWGVQSGPVLWYAGQPVSLKLARDQEARRIVGGVTAANELFLAVVVAGDSLFGGPKLLDLPDILGNIQQQIGIPLEAAINLDGGTASAFLTSRIQLKELKPIGSFMCVD